MENFLLQITCISWPTRVPDLIFVSNFTHYFCEFCSMQLKYQMFKNRISISAFRSCNVFYRTTHCNFCASIWTVCLVCYCTVVHFSQHTSWTSVLLSSNNDNVAFLVFVFLLTELLGTTTSLVSVKNFIFMSCLVPGFFPFSFFYPCVLFMRFETLWKNCFKPFHRGVFNQGLKWTSFTSLTLVHVIVAIASVRFTSQRSMLANSRRTVLNDYFLLKTLLAASQATSTIHLFLCTNYFFSALLK